MAKYLIKFWENRSVRAAQSPFQEALALVITQPSIGLTIAYLWIGCVMVTVDFISQSYF